MADAFPVAADNRQPFANTELLGSSENGGNGVSINARKPQFKIANQTAGLMVVYCKGIDSCKFPNVVIIFVYRLHA
jgi:hypothetical protein